MDHLPNDIGMLVSSINMLLRDEEFDSFESLCCYFDREPNELKTQLEKEGYTYCENQKQIRPIGFDA